MAAKPIAQDDLDHILAATRPLWEQMRGERIFITGGTGFFGCWLLESFCHANRSLDLKACATVLTRSPEVFRAKLPHVTDDSAITLHEGDVRDFEFPEGEFRFLIHAATEASAKQANEAPLEMLSTILAGTQRTLEFAASHGTRKLLLTSSGAVYGKQPSNLTHVPESYTGAPNSLDPASVYAEGKRASELMCALHAKATGMECKIARCFAFCGPHLPLNAHFAIGNFIRDVLAGRTIQMGGDGTPRRSYLYASDLMIWLWTILLEAPSLVPFNVGSDEALSILELAHAVIRALNSNVAVQVAKEAMGGGAVARYVPQVDRAAELGLRQTVGLEEAIRRTAAWYGPDKESG
ncbi:NAD-dependent epimerase/dehydratase family protein [Granulicella tundricola]|uniref:NAD-dependent epimerase/dehydratase n=1 Tax=Granulicella tundricola (strain ATCC BAA-1859 / DSM 23138 / MP5ACTX9) TaxID=1198114 RepID=E8WV89_GRATM|nr:NAD(P)-dependent oxidoreductase [Granulicella tundricola]ADW67264.1 NAD-dependent epimerase/dehydratase [Granulicella tundricola MP5ACTX9]